MMGIIPGSAEPSNRSQAQQFNELNKNLRILNDTMCCPKSAVTYKEIKVAGINTVDVNLLTGTTDALDVSGYNKISFQFVPNTTGASVGNIAFEASNDNVNFVPIQFSNSRSNGFDLYLNASSFPTDPVYFEGVLNYNYLRLRQTVGFAAGRSVTTTAILDTAAYTPTVFNINSTPSPNNFIQIQGDRLYPGQTRGILSLGAYKAFLNYSTSNVSSTKDLSEFATDIYGSLITTTSQSSKASFSCSFTVTPAASATDVVEIYAPSSGTMRLTKIIISGTQTTAGAATFSLIRRNTLDSGGTATAPTIYKFDSLSAGANTAVKAYTANPTISGTSSNVRVVNMVIGGTSSSAQVWDWGLTSASPKLTSSDGGSFAINLGGTTLTGGSLSFTIEFTEE